MKLFEYCKSNKLAIIVVVIGLIATLLMRDVVMQFLDQPALFDSPAQSATILGLMGALVGLLKIIIDFVKWVMGGKKNES